MREEVRAAAGIYNGACFGTASMERFVRVVEAHLSLEQLRHGALHCAKLFDDAGESHPRPLRLILEALGR